MGAKIVTAWNAALEWLSEGVGWLAVQLTGGAHPPAVVTRMHEDQPWADPPVAMESHDHAAFYKYRSAQDTIRLLRDLQLAWVSPLLFDDPFDTQIEIRFGCTGAELIDRLPGAIEELILSDDDLSEAIEPFLRRVIRVARPLRAVMNRTALFAAMRPGIRQGVTNGDVLLGQYAELWTRWLREMRVTCVSEVKDDIMMWSLYADYHRGAVIELKCIPGQETACQAKRVNYRADIPVLGTAEEWVRHITGQELLNLDDLFEKHTLTKSNNWRYQKEWRCLRASPNGARDVVPLVELNPIVPEDVIAVYLGCRMKPDDRAAIIALVASRIPHACVFEARQSRSEFKIEFVPVG